MSKLKDFYDRKDAEEAEREAAFQAFTHRKRGEAKPGRPPHSPPSFVITWAVEGVTTTLQGWTEAAEELGLEVSTLRTYVSQSGGTFDRHARNPRTKAKDIYSVRYTAGKAPPPKAKFSAPVGRPRKGQTNIPS